MSQLSQQLSKIKTSQRQIKIGPSPLQPTILLDAQTARSTSIDIIYTMAVLSYANLIKSNQHIREEGDQLFNQELKDINRNLLSKE
jgi:hypothetical protein